MQLRVVYALQDTSLDKHARVRHKSQQLQSSLKPKLLRLQLQRSRCSYLRTVTTFEQRLKRLVWAELAIHEQATCRQTEAAVRLQRAVRGHLARLKYDPFFLQVLAMLVELESLISLACRWMERVVCPMIPFEVQIV